MNSVIIYKPLTEATTYTGEKLYKTCTPGEFLDIRATNEAVYFDVSKRYVASAHIKDWIQADPEDVATAWETQNLTSSEKRRFEASKTAYLSFWWGSKPITNELVRKFAELAKEGKTASFGR